MRGKNGMGFFDCAEPAVKSNPYPRQEKGRFGFRNGTGKGKKERGIQEGRIALANRCPSVIRGIKPLVLKGKYIMQIREAYKEIQKLLSAGKLYCTALGKKVDKLNTTHEYRKKDGMRPLEDVMRHAPYIPFIPAVLKHGIYDPSMDRKMSGGAVSHEIVCRAEILEGGKPKRIGISVILAEDRVRTELKKISVFRIDDREGMIKSLHPRGSGRGSRKAQAIAVGTQRLESVPGTGKRIRKTGKPVKSFHALVGEILQRFQCHAE